MFIQEKTQWLTSKTVGLDEAGRGCLAGPVVAGAVVLPEKYDLQGLTDSKKLSAHKRSRLAQEIKAQAKAWALGFSWPEEIDRINILQASLQAMARAVAVLSCSVEFLLIDGNQLIPSSLPQKAVVGGDGKVDCISAASILAKTFRDDLLIKLDDFYPGYGLHQHKGYGTRQHLAALQNFGPCALHRKTFQGVCPAKSRELCLPGI